MNKQKPHFHDAVILGKRGAMIYVVDENGNKLSNGHHSIKWGGHDDDWLGKVGATENKFTIDTDKINPWDQRLSRQITLDDIIDGAADERIVALARYLKKYDQIPQV